MNNPAIARIFDEIADLLDFSGENPFRINSYRRAARALLELREDVSDLAARGELEKIPGIGEAMAKKIQEYLASGQVRKHQELVAQFPASLPKLLEIPGLGPKKVAALFNELKIATLEELEAAIRSGHIEKVPKFGKKTAEKLLEGIRFIQASSQRATLLEAAPIAQALRDTVADLPGVRRVEIAGSLRRGCETIGDIDLVCEADDGKRVIADFARVPQASGVRAAGETKGSILVLRPRGGEMQVDLRVVSGECFGAALQYFTGSKDHNVRLRSLAIRRGWQLNEYGLFEGETRLAGCDEREIYERLGVPHLPPELREDRGELECGDLLDRLVCMEDIRGDLHVHTEASDGRSTLEELIAAARARGYTYLAVTDHSRSSAIAGGLPTERLLEHAENVRRLNARLEGFQLLAGTECDILPDGSLDYPDEVLAQLDWVVASIHAAQGQDPAQLMKRTIAALENPYVCVLGHPSGRLLGKRDAMELEWEQVVATAVRTGTALELNCSYQRMDLKDAHVRMAMDAGCWLAIDTDAHSVSELDYIIHGVRTARRGWATRERTLNTHSADWLREWVAAKRGK